MILERLKQYIDFKGITVAAFERSIGMANASFGKSLKNHRAIGTDKLENILSKYPDISPLWLLRGIGDMLLPDPNHPETQPSYAPTYLLDMIKEKDQIIRQQAEELGELREKLKNAQAGKNEHIHHHVQAPVEIVP